MSTDTADRTDLAPAEDSEGEVRDVSLREVGAWVYAFCYSKKVGLLLILAMGLMSLLGVLIQQAPDEVLGNPESYQGWLRTVQQTYDGWTPVLSALGLFHVFSTVWFRATTIALAVSIIACTSHRLPRLWQAATRPHVHVQDRFFEHSRLHCQATLAQPVDEALDLVAERLRKAGYRVLPNGHGDGWYADRFRWMPFGTAVAHVAFVVILVGVLVSSLAGFSDKDFSVTVGSRREVGHQTGLAVAATAFSASHDDQGRPRDYASELVLYQDGAEVARQTVRVNQPLRYRGVAFYQAAYGTAAVVTVRDAGGRTVYSGGVPLQWTSNDGQNVYGRVVLAEQGIEMYVIGAASGAQSTDIKPGQVAVQLYGEGQRQPLGSQVLSPGKEVVLGDLRFTFEREQQFTGLIVARDPGALLVWIGSGLIVVGMVLTLFFRHRRLWVQVRDQSGQAVLRVASPDRQDTVFARQVHGLVTSLSKETPDA